MNPKNPSPAKWKPALLALAALSLGDTRTALAATDPAVVSLPEAKSVTLDKSLTAQQAQAALHVAQLFYTFWNTGEASYAQEVLSPDFVDRTLPKGRPQGATGPLFASRNFRQAVPDLSCEVVQLVVAGDRVVAHLRFRGHFTGKFGDLAGTGQEIDFIATDILRVQDGRITDNWHLEDNLTLMQQLGIVPS